MYPRIFEMATREQIKEALKSAYNSTRNRNKIGLCEHWQRIAHFKI